MFSKFFKRFSASSNEPAPATRQDIVSGKAIFFIQNGESRVYNLGVPLPTEGYVKRPIVSRDGDTVQIGTPITIIQAETSPKNEVLIGAIINGKKFLCTLDEIALGKSDPTENVRRES